MQRQSPRPTELRVSKDRRTLTVTFEGGGRHELPAEMLRVYSPSAEVRGHSPEERKLIYGKRNVAIAEIVPTGNYAIRIVFDDRHDTGIFSWSYLHHLSGELATWPAAYEAELGEKGLSRDP